MAGVHSRTARSNATDPLAWIATLASALPPRPWRTRFAPAPTGHLHLGHLVNAIYVWGVARAYGGHVVLRIEDHDRGRCRPEYETALLDDLDWLGFTPDSGTTTSYRGDAMTHPLRQSNNDARFAAAFAQLERGGLVYACQCSRRDLAVVAPTVEGDERRYPGTCRHAHVNLSLTSARRVQVTPETITFDDIRIGAVSQTPALQCGDFLIRDAHGNWTYQFAVTVDDREQGIDVVIRGEDLLPSTGRQIQLARVLGRSTDVRTLHHPLLVHADGAKLSKANRDTSIGERRAAGATAAQLIGEAAYLVGLITSPASLAAGDVANLFRAI